MSSSLLTLHLKFFSNIWHFSDLFSLFLTCKYNKQNLWIIKILLNHFFATFNKVSRPLASETDTRPETFETETRKNGTRNESRDRDQVSRLHHKSGYIGSAKGIFFYFRRKDNSEICFIFALKRPWYIVCVVGKCSLVRSHYLTLLLLQYRERHSSWARENRSAGDFPLFGHGARFSCWARPWTVRHGAAEDYSLGRCKTQKNCFTWTSVAATNSSFDKAKSCFLFASWSLVAKDLSLPGQPVPYPVVTFIPFHRAR